MLTTIVHVLSYVSFVVSLVVFDPHITAPAADALWLAGSRQNVTWSLDGAPPNFPFNNATGMLVLGFDANNSENLDLDHPLAKDFLIADARVEIAVPFVSTRTDYIVVLFGDSGNASPKFTIRNNNTSGTSSTTTTTASTSTTVPISITTTGGSSIEDPSTFTTSFSSTLSGFSTTSGSGPTSTAPGSSTASQTTGGTTTMLSSGASSGTSGTNTSTLSTPLGNSAHQRAGAVDFFWLGPLSLVFWHIY